MKYLKLFQSNESANNFAINDIPFIGYVNDPSWGVAIAACKDEGMKIAIEGGHVVVKDVPQADFTKYITFTRNDNGQQVTAYKYIGSFDSNYEYSDLPHFITEDGHLYRLSFGHWNN